jgi:hypothetical protein
VVVALWGRSHYVEDVLYDLRWEGDARTIRNLGSRGGGLYYYGEVSRFPSDPSRDVQPERGWSRSGHLDYPGGRGGGALGGGQSGRSYSPTDASRGRPGIRPSLSSVRSSAGSCRTGLCPSQWPPRQPAASGSGTGERGDTAPASAPPVDTTSAPPPAAARSAAHSVINL